MVHFLCLHLLPQDRRIVLDVVLEDRLPLREIFVHKLGTIILNHRLGIFTIRLAFYEGLSLVR